MNILELVALLRAKKVHFELASYRDDAITAVVTVPGERWEIEVFADRPLEIEIFKSSGEICGESILLRKLAEFTDDEDRSD